MNNRALCTSCQRPLPQCYCAQLVMRQNRYPIKILQSIKESKHPFNTGRIAALSLSNCEVLSYRSGLDIATALGQTGNEKLVLAFPSLESTELEPALLDENTALLFIDDTWRKAKRVLHECTRLNTLPKVKIPAQFAPNYALRSARKHHCQTKQKNSAALCTLESITYSLGILEDREAYYEPMLKPLEWLKKQQQQFATKRVQAAREV